jgi:hypothetical protein
MDRTEQYQRVAKATSALVTTVQAQNIVCEVLQRFPTVLEVAERGVEHGGIITPVPVDHTPTNRVVYELIDETKVYAVVNGRRLAYEISLELAKVGIITTTQKLTV